jgi:hypothetical protein
LEDTAARSRKDASFAVALNCGIGSSELFDLWIEIEVVDAPGEMFGNIQLALDESPVDDEFCGFVRDPCRLPSLDLFLHRLEIPLNSIDPDREHIDEAEMLRVLRQHRSECADKSQVAVCWFAILWCNAKRSLIV